MTDKMTMNTNDLQKASRLIYDAMELIDSGPPISEVAGPTEEERRKWAEVDGGCPECGLAWQLVWRLFRELPEAVEKAAADRVIHGVHGKADDPEELPF